MYDEVISTEVTIIQLLEKGEIRNYIDFLFYCPIIMERTEFAAPFIKGDPVTEQLTIEQKYSTDELKKMVPSGQVFHHIVLNFRCTTAEDAYLRTKQFLRDVDIEVLCIIFIHSTNDRYYPYHAHVLISPEYPLEVLLDDPDSIETDEMYRRWQEATDRIPNGIDQKIKGNIRQTMLFDESRYSSNVLLTL